MKSLLASLILCLSAASTQALTITSDPLAFADALARLTLETETIDDLGSIDEASINLGAFTISSSHLLDDSLAPTCLDDACISALDDATIAFEQAQNAVGFFLGGLFSQTLMIAVDGARIGDVLIPAGAVTFVGLYDLTSPFSSISIAAPGSLFEIDQISSGSTNVAPVPAPAALPLLLAGISGLGVIARRRSYRRT